MITCLESIGDDVPLDFTLLLPPFPPSCLQPSRVAQYLLSHGIRCLLLDFHTGWFPTKQGIPQSRSRESLKAFDHLLEDIEILP